MKFWIVSRHLPHPEGTATGRILLAYCAGLIEEGHDVHVVSWGEDPSPGMDPPPWCEYRRLVHLGPLIGRIRSAFTPRTESARLRLETPTDAVVISDDPVSFAAVQHASQPVATFHYSAALDGRALGRRTLRNLQDIRAERRNARRSALNLVYSQRVAPTLGAPSIHVPIAFPVHPRLTPSEKPVAALIAHFDWAPNRAALDNLLTCWPEVQRLVPAARLLIAGRGLRGFQSADGVEFVGSPSRSEEVLSQAAVLAFPSPATSGPKVKVLDALAYGVPVVTTPAGVEGLRLPQGAGAIVTSLAGFAEQLAGLLVDPERGADLGRSGRDAIASGHAPAAAARARVAACAPVAALRS